MSGVFEHSIKVPRLYKTVAKIVQTVSEDGASLKQLVYLKKHPNIKALYALALTSLQHSSQLDQLIRRTKILLNEPRLDPWLARILITELLWGKKQLSSECKPVKTVISYEKLLNEELNNIGDYYLAGNNKKFNKVEKPRYVRVNTLAMSVDEAIGSFEEEGWRPLYRSKNYAEFIEAVSNVSGRSFIQDIHVPELLIFPPKTQFYNHPAYISGAIILQDKASCLPAYLLDARPGSTVLDMCASPGMKTTHLAAMLENKGKIYAVEIDKRRYDTLCEIVNSTNSHCVETLHADVMTLNSENCPDVEYILVDPSCSGSGMLDRLEVEFSGNEKCAPGRLRNLQSFQIIILRHAMLNFPTAKRIVYSTCSIYPEENEQVVDDVLSQVGDSYKLIPARTLMNNNWLNYSSMDFVCKDNCLYARSDTDLSNGFFVAVFERNFEVPLPEIKRKKKLLRVQDGENREELNEGIENDKEEKKKKKKKKMIDDIDDPEKLRIQSEETILDHLNDEIIEAENETARKAEGGLNINEEENSDDNYCGDVIPTKIKKSKRKCENDELIESRLVEDRVCDKISEDIKTKKKTKKCKKSRTEYEEPDDVLETREDDEEGEGEIVVSKKKKSKKSKKTKEIFNIYNEKKQKLIIQNDLVDGEIDEYEENTEENNRKKRKKHKV